MKFAKKSLFTMLLALVMATTHNTVGATSVVASKSSDLKENNKFDVRNGFAEVVEKVLPAVVSIVTTQVIDNKNVGSSGRKMPGGAIPQVPPGSPLEDLFKEFFDQMERPRKVQSLGSGFIIANNTKYLLIVTNSHVINEAKIIKILLNDKTELDATVEATDDRTDIAILKVSLESLPESKRNFPALEWSDSDKVMVGQWVLAIGNPFGFGKTVTTGIISCKGRYVPSGSVQHDFEYIQHSAQINMGNSGGCLLDVNGRVIGINNAIITNSGGNIGIGFAIPSNIAKFTVEQLVKHGRVRRGALGIRIQHLTDDMAEGLGLKTNGAIVGSVAIGGPAEGKMEAGDIILEYEGKKITEPFHLSRMVSETEIGKLSTVKLLRKGKEIEVKIKVVEIKDIKDPTFQSKQEAESVVDDSISVLGLKISSIPPQAHKSKSDKNVRGVMIMHVDSRSPGVDIGLMSGDIIEEANQQEINTPQEFVKVVEQAKANNRKNILLLVTREGEPRYLPLKLEEDKPEKNIEQKKSLKSEQKSEKEETKKDNKEEKTNNTKGEESKTELKEKSPVADKESRTQEPQAKESQDKESHNKYIQDQMKESQVEDKEKKTSAHKDSQNEKDKPDEKEKILKVEDQDSNKKIPKNTTPVTQDPLNLLEQDKDLANSKPNVVKDDKASGGWVDNILKKLRSFF